MVQDCKRRAEIESLISSASNNEHLAENTSDFIEQNDAVVLKELHIFNETHQTLLKKIEQLFCMA